MLINRFDPFWGVARSPFFRRAVPDQVALRAGRENRPRHAPRFGLTADDREVRLELEAPGVSADDIELAVHGLQLSIVVSREPQVPEGFSVVHHERRSWRVERSVELPYRVNLENVVAYLDEGYLTLTLPRAEDEEAVKIMVKRGAEPHRIPQVVDTVEEVETDGDASVVEVKEEV